MCGSWPKLFQLYNKYQLVATTTDFFEVQESKQRDDFTKSPLNSLPDTAHVGIKGLLGWSYSIASIWGDDLSSQSG